MKPSKKRIEGKWNPETATWEKKIEYKISDKLGSERRIHIAKHYATCTMGHEERCAKAETDAITCNCECGGLNHGTKRKSNN